MSFSVGRRTREVGIRMALGAKPGDVVGLVVRQGAWQLGIGMVAGLTLALGVAQLMKVVLFDVQPRDPAIFAAVVTVLSIAGLLACLEHRRDLGDEIARAVDRALSFMVERRAKYA